MEKEDGEGEGDDDGVVGDGVACIVEANTAVGE